MLNNQSEDEDEVFETLLHQENSRLMTLQEKEADRRLLKEVMQLSKVEDEPAPKRANEPTSLLPDIRKPGVPKEQIVEIIPDLEPEQFQGRGLRRHDASFGKLPLMNLDQMDVQAMLEIE